MSYLNLKIGSNTSVAITNLKQMWATRQNREQIYCTASYWDQKAAELDGDAVSMWLNNTLNAYYHRDQLALFERYLPDLQGLNVLDVGCGTGRISRYLATRGAQVTGVDFASQAIAIAQQYTNGDNPTYLVQSMFELDDTPRFNVVVSWGSIAVACKNRDELTETLRRLHHSLQPGGRALLLEPIHQGFLHRVLDMDIREFCQVMTEVGFQIEDVRHLHFYPMRLLLCYFSLPQWLTAVGYYLGEAMMALISHQALGDYKAIYAACG
jgi:2-polyprenyl-3-methyl-5-hydroxy-6-metoxy-1,4-benzoquinol methylase